MKISVQASAAYEKLEVEIKHYKQDTQVEKLVKHLQRFQANQNEEAEMQSTLVWKSLEFFLVLSTLS